MARMYSSRPWPTLLTLLVLVGVVGFLKWTSLVGYVAQRHHVVLPALDNAPAALPWDELWLATGRFNQAIVVGLNRAFYNGGPAGEAETVLAEEPTATQPQKPETPALASVDETSTPQVTAPTKRSKPAMVPAAVQPSAIAAVQPGKPAAAVDPNAANTPLVFAGTRGPVSITRDDKVLFCGDSLMQGLVPFMASRLKSQKIAFKDLSRQSTGLAYPSFFDWPKTVRAEIEAKNVTVLVVFLGANDAWGIIDGGKSFAFNSDVWKDIYRQRVESMVAMAEKAGVRVIWLGLPPMDNNRLTAGAPVLNRVFQEVAARHESMLLIPTDNALTEDGMTFTKFKKSAAGDILRLRADDGIHFAPAGYRLLTELIWNHVEFL